MKREPLAFWHSEGPVQSCACAGLIWAFTVHEMDQMDTLLQVYTLIHNNDHDQKRMNLSASLTCPNRVLLKTFLRNPWVEFNKRSPLYSVSLILKLNTLSLLDKMAFLSNYPKVKFRVVEISCLIKSTMLPKFSSHESSKNIFFFFYTYKMI